MATFTGYDDAFEDDLNDCRHMVLEENEWLRNQEARVKEGYVDGLTEGQDLLLQQGFNEGYRQAAQLSAAIARIKGSVCALLSVHLTRNGTLLSQEAEKDFQALLTNISEVQGQYLCEVGQGLDSKMADIVSLSKRLGLLHTQTERDGNSECISGENTEGVIAGENRHLITGESQSTKDGEKNSSHASGDNINNESEPTSLRDGNGRETTPIGKTNRDPLLTSLDQIKQAFEKLVSLYQVPELI